MYPRIMLTGIPCYLSNTIVRAEGTHVHYRERFPEWSTKAAFLRTMRNISNTGNFLIGEGAMQALPADATVHVPFWHIMGRNLDNPDFLRNLKNRFDVCVLTAANLIRSDLSAEVEARVLERIDLPLVVLGIGIQRTSDLEQSLPPGTEKFLRVLRERNAFVMTRGEETAAYLKRIGITQARPSGCPSMYHMRDYIVAAWRKLPTFIPSRKARYIFSGYLGNENEWGVIRDINEMIDPDASCCYVLQDEPVSYGMEIGGADEEIIYNNVTGQLTGKVSFPHRELVQPRLHIHNFFDTTQWRTWTAGAGDFSLQRRFHGHIVALQAGVPSIAIALDDRMREMLNYVGFPFMEQEAWQSQQDRLSCLSDFIRGIPVDAVIDRYLEREATFRDNLRDAGLTQ
jgi:hypothetical protein